MVNTELFDRWYRGDGQRQGPFPEEVVMPEDKDIHEFFTKDLVRTPEPYIPDRELVKAVNVALYLRRPLLLEGEPGCGKTRLAFAIAHELGYPLKECYIRSTSLAQELLYTYDGLRRLHDMQGSPKERARALKRKQYISFGKLGEAILLAEQNIPSVVLIDEIDKADIDFPNDLLQVLDRLQFEISEVNNLKFDALQGGREQRRNVLPLIIITSNREKELPKPFLRRCLYYYIQFPDRDMLKEIIKAHFHQSEVVPGSLFDVALTKFEGLRSPENAIRWRKTPGTGEMLDWISVLHRDERAGEIDSQLLDQSSLGSLPYPETLVKTQSDQQALTKIRLKDIEEI